MKIISPHELTDLAPSSAILLGFSGGADSRALLHLLSIYCKENDAPLFAAHIEHGIRGDEAKRDLEFCRETAESYGIRLFTLECDVPALAREHHRGIEEEARCVRYEFFEKVMRENNIPILATAHNADDRLETMLFSLSRGCGIRGISGIPTVRREDYGVIIRPLIREQKCDIIKYCEENSLGYVTDSTNGDTKYSRNLLRHEVIPLLRRINPGVVKNAARLASSAADAEDFICAEAERYILENKDSAYSIKKLKALHPALKIRVLEMMYSKAECNNGSTAEWVHLNELCSLIDRGVGNSALSLPGLVRAQIVRGKLTFCRDPRGDIVRN